MHMSMYVYNMFIQLIQCTVIEILQNRTLVIYWYILKKSMDYSILDKSENIKIIN